MTNRAPSHPRKTIHYVDTSDWATKRIAVELLLSRAQKPSGASLGGYSWGSVTLIRPREAKRSLAQVAPTAPLIPHLSLQRGKCKALQLGHEIVSLSPSCQWGLACGFVSRQPAAEDQRCNLSGGLWEDAAEGSREAEETLEKGGRGRGSARAAVHTRAGRALISSAHLRSSPCSARWIVKKQWLFPSSGPGSRRSIWQAGSTLSRGPVLAVAVCAHVYMPCRVPKRPGGGQGSHGQGDTSLSGLGGCGSQAITMATQQGPPGTEPNLELLKT